MKASELRKSILQAAVQGKLVSQNPQDEPASELFKCIQAEKEKLLKEKKIKKEKPLPAITEEEIPFELPQGWIWCRLGDATLNNIGGGTPSKDKPEFWNGEIPWASVKDLQTNEIHFTQDHITALGLAKSSSNLIPKGSIIVCTRMGLGKIAKNEIDVAINQDLRALTLPVQISVNYFINWYKTISLEGGGTTVKGITLIELNSFLIPLPPLEEQKRIVAKVDELMLLCDELEKAEKTADNLDKNFFSNLPKSILQSAIKGELLPQCPTDEPASELFKRIQVKKEQLIKDKKLKKEKPLPAITEEEIPFELPQGWIWCRLGDLTSVKGGKRVPLGKSLQDTKTEHIYIRVTDMKNNTISNKSIKYISSDVFELIKQYTISKEDLYLTIAGTIGSVGIVPDSFNNMNLTENAVKLCNIQIDKLFLLQLIKSDFVQKQFQEKVNQMAQPKLAIMRILTTLIPLPPLEEQKRIVAKVDELMALCEEFKAL